MINILNTTPAMSLLYECVDGIVDGGILASVEGTMEGDELAKLCVGKLRSMLVVEGDPNRKKLDCFRERLQTNNNSEICRFTHV
jgi:AP-3 complex subunit delta